MGSPFPEDKPHITSFRDIKGTTILTQALRVHTAACSTMLLISCRNVI
jgi:hypothetical protein